MIIEGLVQNTPEWLMHRLGMVTASRVADVTAKLKNGKYSAARDKYLMDVVIERLTGRAAENYVSPSMEWGIENEPLARAAYEMEQDAEVELIGFATHPTIEWFGASPDGLVGKHGLVELKCPNTSTHLAYLLDKEVPVDYLPQMKAQMACTERQWCDFVSFDPRLPKNLQFFVRRFHRDQEMITQMEEEVTKFLDEVVLKLAELAGVADSINQS
jgi:putative phage-type endonuclease